MLRGPALLLLVLVLGCGDNLAPDDGCAPRLSRPILQGTLDDAHPAVAAVNLLTAVCTRAGVPECTGTLVGATEVLTAAHCVDPPAPSLYGVLFGADGDAGSGPLGDGLDGRFFRVIAIDLHPGFDPATLDHDLARLTLDAAPAIAPLAFPDAPLDATAVGGAATVVGFGQADADPPFAKRDGAVTVTALDAATLTYGPAPAMTCQGDSGGPVLVDTGGGERLAAVTSRGDAACVERGVAVRVDSEAARTW